MVNYDDILRRILLRRSLITIKTAGRRKPPFLSLVDLLLAADRGEDISKLPHLMANRIKGIEFPAHMPLADRVRIVEQAIKDKNWTLAKAMLDQFLRGEKAEGLGSTAAQRVERLNLSEAGSLPAPSIAPPAPPPVPPSASPPVASASGAPLPPPAAQRRSLWPWILGGAGLTAAGGIGAYAGLRENDSFAGRVRRHLRSLGIEV